MSHFYTSTTAYGSLKEKKKAETEQTKKIDELSDFLHKKLPDEVFYDEHPVDAAMRIIREKGPIEGPGSKVEASNANWHTDLQEAEQKDKG